MALIKCNECGKEFSDKASACPNCGCPIEFARKKVEKPLEIVGKYNIWDYEFLIDKDMDFYLMLTRQTQISREEWIKSAERVYESLGSIDSVIEDFPEYYASQLDEMMNTAVTALVSRGIYECDKDYLIQKYGYLLDASYIMEPIVERYLEIQNLQDELKEYREYIRQQRRNTWSGGGFGISGAIKGHFKAQMLNAGTAFLHMIPDNAAHSRNMSEIIKIKERLYRDIRTKEAIVVALLNIFDAFNELVIKEFINAGKMRKIEFDMEKANRILNNVYLVIESGEYEKESIKNQCLEAFKLDPTNQDLIECMLMLDDKTKEQEIKKYANKYGFAQEYIKEEERSEKRDIAEKNSFIECCNKIIETNAAFLEIFNKGVYLKKKGFDCEDYINKALVSRVKYNFTSSEKNEIYKLLLKYEKEGIFDKVFISDAKKLINKIVINCYDFDLIKEVVKEVCYEYSYKKDYNDTFFIPSDFKFGNVCDIYKTKKYTEYAEYAEIPSKDEVYVLWALWDDNEKCPKSVVAVTNSGIYAYFYPASKSISKLWKEFAVDSFIMATNKIKTGGACFDTTDIDLYDLLKDIRKSLRDYWKLDDLQKDNKNIPKEWEETIVYGVKYDTIEEAILVKKEIYEVCRVFSQTNISIEERYEKILSYPFETEQAEKYAQDKLSSYILQLVKGSEAKNNKRRNYSFIDIIFFILIIVIAGGIAFAAYIFTEYGREVLCFNIIGIVGYFIVNVCFSLKDNSKAKKKAMLCEEELSRIRKVCGAKKEHLFLKK